MGTKKSLNRYFVFVLLIYSLILLFRLLEFILFSFSNGFSFSALSAEATGFVYDCLYTSIVVTIFYPIFILLFTWNRLFIKYLCLFLVFFFSLLHLIILKLYIFQASPIDTYLLGYNLSEIGHIVHNAFGSSFKMVGWIIGIVILVFLLYRFYSKRSFHEIVIRRAVQLIILCIPVFFVFQKFIVPDFNNLEKNKSIYFYNKAVPFIIRSVEKNNTISKSDIEAFHQFFPGENFVNDSFPLLHTIDTAYLAKNIFSRFDSAPNVVVVIVEGLNDDFIHTFHGKQLMPFLSQLKDKSLYWSKCFSLGDMPFAVMPNILGGLPYGDNEFTLLPTLPRNINLINILKTNGYYSTFFYGQSCYNNQMEHFLQLSNIDLIFDNGKFSNKYKKIIFGNDKIFWGYNDRDLFCQSLEVIDTLKESKRFDIYFTGSMHYPFPIENSTYYDRIVSNFVVNNPDKNSKILLRYKKNVKSILFTDDALRNFFEEYKKKPGYENTIFVITGNQAMWDIPVSNSLKRYHVPLIIYSPKLLQPKEFSDYPVSHLDLMESILFILKPYLSNYPDVLPSLGKNLFDKKTRPLAFMNNYATKEFFWDQFYLSDKKLYSVDSALNLTPLKDKGIRKMMKNNLEVWKKVNSFVSTNNLLISENQYFKILGYKPIYKINNKEVKDITGEYYSLVPETPINKENLLLEINFSYLSRPSENISIVYQISDRNDSILYWKNTKIRLNESKVFQTSITIGALKGATFDTLIFKSFLWNPRKENILISRINISAGKKF
jgi:uncharacterized sulfatase